jgi:anti-sigma regulatory factor (Ser/Thr protein kinase)
MAKISSELRLPVTLRILPFVRAHVRELAALSKLPPDRVEALLSSVAEACTNIIKYAFNPEQADTFSIKSELTPSALTISLIDEGIPFDQSFSPQCPPSKDLSDTHDNTPGLGLCLIRNLVDEMQWVNHGRAGKELRLILYDVQPDMVGQSGEEQLPPFREDEIPAPEQHCLIRRLPAR